MEAKKNVSRSTDEAIPNVSAASSHVISNPWKESENALKWMIDQEVDCLFKVRHNLSLSFSPVVY